MEKNKLLNVNYKIHLNMYLNHMVHGSISTEGKNFTSEEGGENCDVIVSGAPKAQAVTDVMFV
jgi:hypothetical protein